MSLFFSHCITQGKGVGAFGVSCKGTFYKDFVPVADL